MRAAAGGGPIGERLEAVAILPGELEEFAGVEIGGFFTEERFKAPLDVGAIPGIEPVAARGEPVELEQVEHEVSDIGYLISV